MTFIEKVKLWIKDMGFTNLGWAAGFAVSAFAGWWFIAGGCSFVFVYSNWNSLRKIYSNVSGGESETQ